MWVVEMVEISHIYHFILFSIIVINKMKMRQELMRFFKLKDHNNDFKK